ncbi:nucleotide exchange factor GrpE [Actinomyces naeslundii]|uniref:nucleotide exchange factor GrpE n=1 Tax=Actinomyces naeslundii TaxID=1655 RepID=UPI00096D53CD|nr:nucleotide exchange factor GrpE [Actinomyces naeslundii]OMG21236.1 nucleotide exchange factor GrpE [Actinomyces naeslundii]OMG31024.1 nucleotide exchange factor GrpE [Actinomyces naeslundii]OMG32086.1 nucleotide exchange factor GrpE [Actinomyces naeslundii]OMG40144.1 nucleotide exchange factor GrpE [Actinomyces naeslundii]
MTPAGPTPENEGIDPELQAAVESAFEEVPDDVREGLAQGSPEGAAGQSDASSPDEGEAGDDPLAQAQAQAAQAADDLARARADLYNLQQEYQGFVRRSREGAASHRQAGAADVVEALIPVLDEIELARQHGDLTGTFETTAGKLESILAEKYSLERFGAVGEVFDPTLHEALMATESSEVTEPTIATVLQPGYRLGERVVRAARVQVANPA